MESVWTNMRLRFIVVGRYLGAELRYVLTVLLLTAACVAQTRMYVDQQGNDSVGGRVVFSFKEAAKKSSSYLLVDDPKNSLVVNFVTMDSWVDGVQIQPSRGSASYISMIVYMNVPSTDCQDALPQLVISHDLRLIGSSRVVEAAESFLASIDKTVSELRHSPKEAAK